MINHSRCSLRDLIWLVAIACLLLTACTDATPSHEPQAAPAATVYMASQASVVIMVSIEDLVRYADTIIVGRPVAEAGIINSARDPDDLSKPDPTYFGIAQVYEVEVLNYIRGNGPSTLYISQSEGRLLLSSENWTESNIEQAHEQARQSGDFIPLALNERYIMFLRNARSAYIDFPADNYLAASYPWKFRIDDADCVYPESAYRLTDLWPPQTLESFLSDIANPPPTPESSPYPAPVVHGTPCQPALPAAPYP